MLRYVYLYVGTTQTNVKFQGSNFPHESHVITWAIWTHFRSLEVSKEHHSMPFPDNGLWYRDCYEKQKYFNLTNGRTDNVKFDLWGDPKLLGVNWYIGITWVVKDDMLYKPKGHWTSSKVNFGLKYFFGGGAELKKILVILWVKNSCFTEWCNCWNKLNMITTNSWGCSVNWCSSRQFKGYSESN